MNWKIKLDVDLFVRDADRDQIYPATLSVSKTKNEFVYNFVVETKCVIVEDVSVVSVRIKGKNVPGLKWSKQGALGSERYMKKEGWHLSICGGPRRGNAIKIFMDAGTSPMPKKLRKWVLDLDETMNKVFTGKKS